MSNQARVNLTFDNRRVALFFKREAFPWTYVRLHECPRHWRSSASSFPPGALPIPAPGLASFSSPQLHPPPKKSSVTPARFTCSLAFALPSPCMCSGICPAVWPAPARSRNSPPSMACSPVQLIPISFRTSTTNTGPSAIPIPPSGKSPCSTPATASRSQPASKAAIFPCGSPTVPTIPAPPTSASASNGSKRI